MFLPLTPSYVNRCSEQEDVSVGGDPSAVLSRDRRSDVHRRTGSIGSLTTTGPLRSVLPLSRGPCEFGVTWDGGPLRFDVVPDPAGASGASDVGRVLLWDTRYTNLRSLE